MKIKVTTTFILLFTTISLFAQYPTQGAKDKDFQELFNSKVYVVKTGDETMDKATETAFSEYWKITGFEMISSAQLADMVSDESKYFFFNVEVKTETTSSIMTTNRTSKYFVLSRGGYKNIEKIKMQNWLFGFPEDSWNQESDATDMAYRMEPNIKLMNEVIKTIKDTDAKVSFGKSAAEYMTEQYSGKLSELKNKTLLINQSNVQPEGWKPDRKNESSGEILVTKGSPTANEIKEDYPYKFEVVSSADFKDAFKNHRSGTAAVIQVAFTNFLYYIIDTETYDCLGFGYKTMGYSLKGKDYKDIVKEMK